MELTLTGKRVLVTGASSGLGLHFAQVLARSGAEVTLAARRFSKVQKAAEEIRLDGYAGEALELDVTDKISVTKAFSADHYDVVINNAGISGSGRALEMKIEEFESVLQTNLTGVFAVAQ
ncbi:MAG: SDR family NAD(P)-dependent oxidoreductase, partial [Proteobacteria bacterium]|nr:SDR family NAD(P)-dependent oxidoreductase [Pseudomonadota bacterium]